MKLFLRSNLSQGHTDKSFLVSSTVLVTVGSLEVFDIL